MYFLDNMEIEKLKIFQECEAFYSKVEILVFVQLAI